MKLKEAIEALEEGKKIRHVDFHAMRVIKMFSAKDGRIPILCSLKNKKFPYNPSIFKSEYWQVEGLKEPLYFLDALEHVLQGKRAWINEWKEDQYISMNGSEIHHYWYEQDDYVIPVQQLISDEWEVV